jgi:hypothetical protein
MHCTDFHHRLDAILDDRRDPATDRQLAAHAGDCHRCRQVLAEHQMLLLGTSRLEAPAPGPDFSRRVVLAAVADRPRAIAKIRWQTGPAIVAVLASAAAMLLAISLTWLSRSGNPAGNKDVLWTSFSGFGVTTPPYERKGPQKAGGNFTIADVLLQTPHLPQRFGAYRSQIDLAVALPAAAQRLDQIEQIAPGLRPLRASLSVIWETLMLTIPAPVSDSSQPQRDGIGSWFETAIGIV